MLSSAFWEAALVSLSQRENYGCLQDYKIALTELSSFGNNTSVRSQIKRFDRHKTLVNVTHEDAM